MADNKGSMAVLSDEGGIFDIISGFYSEGRSNIDLFLQGHSGGGVLYALTEVLALISILMKLF